MGLMELYFSPSERINRSTFWLKGVLLLNAIWFLVNIVWSILFSIAVGSAISDLDNFSSAADENTAIFVLLFLLLIVLAAIYCWNSFAVIVKRLHDRDKSAWWLLLWWAIAVVGGALTFGIAAIVVAVWAFIELGLLPGNPHQNRYGYSPDYESYAEGVLRGSRYGYARQPAEAAQTSRPTRNCPYCAEAVLQEAVKCRFCDSDLPPVPQAPPAPEPRSRSPRIAKPTVKTCPYCAESIAYEEIKCRFCRADLPAVQQAPSPQSQQASAPASPQAPSTQSARRMKVCSHCSESIAYEEIKCNFCGADLGAE